MNLAEAMNGLEKDRAMSPDQFRARFKVGDWVTAWTTSKPIQITAIGEQRFLFRDPQRPRQEFVHRIAGLHWRQVRRG